jgi:hypothetical protein
VLLPGVREAVDRKDWQAAQREAAALAAALHRAAERLDEVSRLAGSAVAASAPARTSSGDSPR